MSVEVTASKNNSPLGNKFIVGASLAMCGLATLIVIGILAKVHVIKGINSGWSTAMITVGNVVAWGGLLSFLAWDLTCCPRSALAIKNGNKIYWELLKRSNLPFNDLELGQYLRRVNKGEYIYYKESGLLQFGVFYIPNVSNPIPTSQNVRQLNVDLSNFSEVTVEELKRRDQNAIYIPHEVDFFS